MAFATGRRLGRVLARYLSVAGLTVGVIMAVSNRDAWSDAGSGGSKIRRTGLIPRFPADRICPPLTSLFGSWDDVDGSKRDEPHSGVDAGRLGDQIVSPGPGLVIASWKANWGWGEEGALLIQHSREEIGLAGGPPYYFSEFDHLRLEDALHFQKGARIDRGQPIGLVWRPGGHEHYLPEVHWEVWQVHDPAAMKWSNNRFFGRYWVNSTADLVDPLHMMSFNSPPSSPDGSVDIPVLGRDQAERPTRGFTYIFPCPRR